MRKAVKIGFIGVFCAVIGLAFPVFNIFSKQLSMDSHENRLMTGLPQVLQSPLRELPRNLDNFLVDNSPFRYQFVLVNAGLDYALFGTSQSDQVLPGKDGVAQMQFDLLRRHAAAGESFVVLGRCAEEVLADYECLVSIFVEADLDVLQGRPQRRAADGKLSGAGRAERQRRHTGRGQRGLADLE